MIHLSHRIKTHAVGAVLAAAMLTAAFATSALAGGPNFSTPDGPATGPAATAIVKNSDGTGTTTKSLEIGPSVPIHGALSVNGTDLVDQSGNPFQLKGISTHGIAWYPQYINEDTFRSLRDSFGANAVRLAMYTSEYNGYLSGGDRNHLESLIDTGVQAAENLGMYVVIDWHILNDGNPNDHTAEAIDFFGRMSAKYAGKPNVIYEICNEPNGVSWADVKNYADQVIPAIRANDANAIIICGTPNWSQDVDQVAANPLANPRNVMYALHFYAGAHKDAIRDKVVQARSQGTPVIISEFSICDASGNGSIDLESAAAWRDRILADNLSYFCWNLSNKNETSALLVPECKKLSDWQDSEDLSRTGKWLKALILGVQ